MTFFKKIVIEYNAVHVLSGFVRGYTGRQNILIEAPALAATQNPPPLATGTLRSTTHLAMGPAKRGGFWVVLGHFGPRAANLAENTGKTANCLFWRIHLGPSMPAISGLSGPGGPWGPQRKWRDGVGVAGREMGPPLWADVFTLKMVNTAVQYPSQILSSFTRFTA